jgi:hypothetical protein
MFLFQLINFDIKLIFDPKVEYSLTALKSVSTSSEYQCALLLQFTLTSPTTKYLSELKMQKLPVEPRAQLG